MDIIHVRSKAATAYGVGEEGRDDMVACLQRGLPSQGKIIAPGEIAFQLNIPLGRYILWEDLIGEEAFASGETLTAALKRISPDAIVFGLPVTTVHHTAFLVDNKAVRHYIDTGYVTSLFGDWRVALKKPEDTPFGVKEAE